jgi:hypothetical protein
MAFLEGKHYSGMPRDPTPASLCIRSRPRLSRSATPLSAQLSLLLKSKGRIDDETLARELLNIANGLM